MVNGPAFGGQWPPKRFTYCLTLTHSYSAEKGCFQDMVEVLEDGERLMWLGWGAPGQKLVTDFELAHNPILAPACLQHV